MSYGHLFVFYIPTMRHDSIQGTLRFNFDRLIYRSTGFCFWPSGRPALLILLFLVTFSHELIDIPYKVVPWTWQQHSVLLNVWKYDCYYVVSCVLNTTRESLAFEFGSET